MADTFAGVTDIRRGLMVTRGTSNMPRPAISWGMRERSDDARTGAKPRPRGSPQRRRRARLLADEPERSARPLNGMLTGIQGSFWGQVLEAFATTVGPRVVEILSERS